MPSREANPSFEPKRRDLSHNMMTKKKKGKKAMDLDTAKTNYRLASFQRPPTWPRGMGGIHAVSTLMPTWMHPMTQNALA